MEVERDRYFKGEFGEIGLGFWKFLLNHLNFVIPA
jgi:hypothetical protein